MASDDIRAQLRKIESDRVSAGKCRHCGGGVPCWSEFGDHCVGVRHSRRTLAAMRRKGVAA